MKKESRKPGELLKMFRAGGMKRKAALKASGVKDTGSFHGKSNKLGHGGRAAQLKAQGVPGGVIGNLARAAHAAPGQKNYHGKKAKGAKRGKVPEPLQGSEQAAMKSSRRAKHMKRSKGATHIHVHFHKDAEQGYAQEDKEEGKKEFKKARKNAVEGAKEAHDEPQGAGQETKEEGKHEFKRKGSTCMKCKGAHKTSEHGKKKSK
jgi:hypothetical protein